MALSAGEVETVLSLRDQFSDALQAARDAVAGFAPDLASLTAQVPELETVLASSGQTATETGGVWSTAWDSMFAAASSAMSGIDGAVTSVGESIGETLKSGIEDPLGAVQDAFTSTLEAMGPFGVGLAGIGTGAAAAGAALYELAGHAAETEESMLVFSKETGESAQQVEQLKYVADITGSSLDQMQSFSFLLARQMAATGTAGDKFAAGLKALRIDADDFKNATLNEQLVMISQGLNQGADGMTNMNAVLDLLTRRGMQYFPMLTKDIGDATETAKTMALNMSGEDLQAAEDYSVAVNKLKEAFSNLSTELGSRLIPYLTEAFSSMAKTISVGGLQGTGGLFAPGPGGLSSLIGSTYSTLTGPTPSVPTAPGPPALTGALPSGPAMSGAAAEAEMNPLTSKLTMDSLAASTAAILAAQQAANQYAAAWQTVSENFGKVLWADLDANLRGQIDDMHQAGDSVNTIVTALGAQTVTTQQVNETIGAYNTYLGEMKGEAGLTHDATDLLAKSQGDINQAINLGLDPTNAIAASWQVLTNDGLAPASAQFNVLDGSINETKDYTNELRTTVDTFGNTATTLGQTTIPSLGKSLYALQQNTTGVADTTQQFTLLSTQGFQQMGSALTELAKVSGGTFGAMITDLANTLKAVESVQKGITAMTAPGASTGQQITGGVTAGVGAVAAIEQPGAAGLIGGAAAGAEIGSVAGPYGAAIGAAVGFVVAAVSDLFKDTTLTDIARDGGKNFGEAWSASLVKQIEETTNALGGNEQAAELYNLPNIIKENPIDTSNLDMYEGKMNDLFSMLQTGALTWKQTTDVLDATFPQMAAAATDAYGNVDAGIKKVIADNEAMGTSDQAIATFLSTQATTAATGFDAMAAAVGNSQSALQALGDQAVTVYATMIANGSTSTAALKAIGPGLDTLTAEYKTLGISVTDVGLKSLLMEEAMTTANPALMAGISGLSSSMSALNNMGLETLKTFQDQETTGMALYTQLQASAAAAGGTTADALAPMQDYLHNAQIQATNLGVPLDANTQMLINQSKELGIWQDTGETATQKLTDGMTTLVQTVQNLVNVLEKVPGALNAIPGLGPAGGPANAGGASAGGLVTSRGVAQYLAIGGPVGTDTVPAWLTPGERVLSVAENQAYSSAGPGGVTVPVTLMIDGRQLAQVLLPLSAKQLRLARLV